MALRPRHPAQGCRCARGEERSSALPDHCAARPAGPPRRPPAATPHAQAVQIALGGRTAAERGRAGQALGVGDPGGINGNGFARFALQIYLNSPGFVFLLIT